MSRTIISVQELPMGDDVVVYFRLSEPTDVPEGEKSCLLVCRPNQGVFSDLAAIVAGDPDAIANELVKAAGAEVFQALSGHPGVQSALDGTVHAADPPTRPIFIETLATASESLPWEAIYHPAGQFLSLDARFPMARIPGGSRVEAVERSFEPPLRIAAVLGAADRDATPEWKALHKAIEVSGIDCHVSLFVAQRELYEQMEAEADDRVDLHWIPSDANGLIDRLVSAHPHLLHVFCHGVAQPTGYLEVATRQHLEMGAEPVYLEKTHLGRLKSTVWLVTLDACEGAAPASNGHSLAYSLVKEGLPAAIGMREPIDSKAANVFCGAFYRGLLSFMSERLVAGQTFVVPWWEFMHAPRSALCDLHPGPTSVKAALYKEWTLPVLYQRGEPFQVQTHAGTGLISLTELDTLRELREGLHPDTPADVTARLDAAIAALGEAVNAGP